MVQEGSLGMDFTQPAVFVVILPSTIVQSLYSVEITDIFCQKNSENAFLVNVIPSNFLETGQQTKTTSSLPFPFRLA